MTRREPWPWIVAAGLGSMVAISTAFAVLAHLHPDPLVVEDAYRAGLAWNEERRASERADAAGWRFDLRAEAQGDALRLRLVALDAQGGRLSPDRLDVRRVRPSEGGYDAEFPVDADGRVEIPLPRTGRWHLVARAQLDGAVLERVYRVER